MTRVSPKGPYVTRFRRTVRRLVMPASREIPLAVIQDEMRRQLHAGRHTVVENSWRDAPGYYTVGEIQDILAGVSGAPDHRTVSVRYVTGGMRHGLGESIDLRQGVGVVEFQRRHSPGFSR